MTMNRVAVSLVDLQPAAALYRALGEPVRLSILQHLANGEHRVRDLTDHLGLAQSTVSAHLACLRDCGLVDSRPDGRASVYSLRDPGRLTDLLAATDTYLAVTGSAAAVHDHMTDHHASDGSGDGR